jgi:PAS domain S-box-containing protein
MAANPQQDFAAAVTVRCRKLLERIPDLAWLMTDRGEILAGNQRWCDYIGRYDLVSIEDASADLGGVGAPGKHQVRTFTDVLHPDELDRFTHAWAEARRWLRSLTIKLQLQSALLAWEWFELELEPYTNEWGQTSWICSAKRLGGEASIPDRQQSTQFLEALLAHASDGIVACDAEGRLVLFNPMAQIFHGLPPEPLPPEEWAQYYNLYDGDGVRLLTKSEVPLFRALQGESVVDCEMTIRATHGGTRSLLANATAIYSETGEKLGAVALMRDITAHKQAMMALKHSERKFRAIFDGVFQFIGLATPDGTLIEVNQTALNFGGIAAEAAIGRRFWEVPGWKFSAATQSQLCAATARAAEGEFSRLRIELAGQADRSIPIDFTLTPIRNERGEVNMLIPEGRDLSQIEQVDRDRQRAERDSERLGAALQVAQAGAWYWEIQENKLYWTREFEILFDYEPGSTQKIYSEWIERVHPDDRQRVEDIVQETISGRLPQHRCEYRVVNRDGRIRWLDGIGELRSDEAGKLYLSGLVYDITDRKQQEEALRRSEEFTRHILESNKDCIKVFDLDGRLLYMNNNGQAMLEIDDFATIFNNPWRKLWQGNEAEQIDRSLALAKAGKTGGFEGYCPTATGIPKWWEVVVTPILDAEGRVDRILSVARDITDRYQAAIALQASEELFRHTFEQTAIGLAHVSLDGTWLRVNQKLCDILGYDREELLATTFQAITEPEDLAEDLRLVAQLLNGEIDEYTLEKRYIHKRGHHVWIGLTVALVRENVIAANIGAPKHFISAIQDITARKQLEIINHNQTAELEQLNSSLLLVQQRLKQRNEDLDSFVYMVSHDLKAPLRSISNLSEWIAEDLEDRLVESDREQFALLHQRVKRMDALIDGLLRYSRVGTQQLTAETVDVAQLLAETIDSLAPPANFQLEILLPLPTLKTKGILLSQVFANLLNNAIKHHDRTSGRIEISAQDLGDRYQFSIADDGPGIPPDARSRIFDIFQTLKPSHSSSNTGIGLALVKKIVEGEGGQIWLATDRPTGACFQFTWLIDN